jgi:hypothetical protein
LGRGVYRTLTFIAILASNELDQIFLAQFLHRACPDARLIFMEADLLLARDVDNAPFIGSVTITPYPRIDLDGARHTYADSLSEAFYNAASYTFWRIWPNNETKPKTPLFQDYSSPLPSNCYRQPFVWATALGRDGYYPLAVLSPSASDTFQFLPAFDENGDAAQESREVKPAMPAANVLHPCLLWLALLALVCSMCVSQAFTLCVAEYLSPVTVDLAIRAIDQPHRRCAYIRAAAATLFSMAWVLSFPVLRLAFVAHVSGVSVAETIVALVLGIVMLAVSAWKTRGYIGWASPKERPYLFLDLVTCTVLIGVVVLWFYLCRADYAMPDSSKLTGEHPYLVGFSFCYRSIHPDSGVSPLVPVLLLLFGWYVWAVLQTLRLRFSDSGRPRLPKKLDDAAVGRMFVADENLNRGGSIASVWLYRNITSPLITREMVYRSFGLSEAADISECWLIDAVVIFAYGVALGALALFAPVRSLDHFLWNTSAVGDVSCWYEVLVDLLFFPLIFASLTCCVRMLLIWGALKKGLLERLENMPIRCAFSRLKVMGWTTMLRNGGVQEQWRDMARSLESMRQMLHEPDLLKSDCYLRHLRTKHTSLEEKINQFLARDGEPEKPDSDFMQETESELAEFSRELLSTILIPYWTYQRTGLVQSAKAAGISDKHGEYESHDCAGCPPAPDRILAAEEFVAIRYLSLIRAVLVNLRYLMIFVTASFVLAVWAWNSYPFQPRQLGDWAFTGLLGVLGTAGIWVFAEMHRNPILSRITDTKANELGFDFYLRVISFSALPVFTWVAYQFPDVGNFISKFLQPSAGVIK